MKFPKKELATIILWIVGFVFLIYSVPLVVNFFQPVLVGALIALIVYPMVRFLEKKFKIIKPFGMTIVSIFIIIIIIAAGYFVIVFLYEEVVNLISDIPSMYVSANNMLDSILAYLKELGEDFPILNQYVQTLENFEITLPNVNMIVDYIGEITDSVFKFAKSLPDLIINLVFICLFAVLFTLNGNNIKEKLDTLFNNDKKKSNNFYLIIIKLKNILSGYVSAQLKLLLITFVIVFVGFNIADIEYVFLVSLVTALLDMLPFFGTGTILGPYAVIAFIYGDYRVGIGCIIIYLITFIVRRAIEPKLVGESIGVSSLFSVFCMFIGYRAVGLLGLIFGIPVGVIILYLYKLGFFKNFIESLKTIKDYFKSLIFS